jgi:hypothetical protein
MNATAIHDFVAGKFSKKTSFIYLALVLGSFLTFLLAALAAYPGMYGMSTNAISNLGNHELNPFPGWFLFSVGLWIFGFSGLPLFFYQFRALKHVLKWAAFICLLCSITSSAGMIGVGIFSEDQDFPLHVAFAAMAFGGMVFSAVFSWFSIMAMVIKEKNARTKKIIAGILVFMMATLIVVAATIGSLYLDIHSLGMAEDSLPSIELWEWIFFFTLASQTIFLLVLINIPRA